MAYYSARTGFNGCLWRGRQNRWWARSTTCWSAWCGKSLARRRSASPTAPTGAGSYDLSCVCGTYAPHMAGVHCDPPNLVQWLRASVVLLHLQSAYPPPRVRNVNLTISARTAGVLTSCASYGIRMTERRTHRRRLSFWSRSRASLGPGL